MGFLTLLKVKTRSEQALEGRVKGGVGKGGGGGGGGKPSHSLGRPLSCIVTILEGGKKLCHTGLRYLHLRPHY